ncbi:ThiF family adenylyltransferase [Pseudoalteromonas luteoviolacea]|uniref:THIF-type NAD/FAD binding fold domain-containing protein n=1 Tax=Pseudoalteromonas luteoviolacea S4060-1 TaxID=1365257 RepID=A0A167JAK1_9GAMM|nr:ThiF family adenylyltransferase [Pseudoalteromonas luteoviolacea]KZN60838.1 hypothetical protein N478_25880 [Pseudoalteromonas luteoviolacea S4060-1]
MEHNLAKWVDYLNENGLSAQVNSSKPSSLLFNCNASGNSFVIRCDIGKNFPWELPSYHLEERKKYDHLAHVAWGEDGYASICIGSEERFAVNFDFPEKIIFESFKKALKAVDKAFTNPEYNYSELKREFREVWRFHIRAGNRCGLYYGELPSIFTEIEAREPLKDSRGLEAKLAFKPFSIKGRQDAVISSMSNNRRLAKGKAVFVPIDCEELVIPPHPNESIKDWWKRQYSNLNIGKKLELARYSRRNKARTFYAVLGVQYNDQATAVGISFSSPTKEKVPLDYANIASWDAQAISIDIISASNMLPRSGSDTSLNEKHVCIVGCGSVGGFAADIISSLGIGRLTLVDYDMFKPENLHRHFLDACYLYELKSLALSNQLNYKYPFLNAQYKVERLCNIEKLEKYDAIILATGNVNAERKFHRFARENNVRIPIITTWLEAYGVGGHAVVSTIGKKGCLECTYLGLSSGLPELSNSLNFIEPGQYIIESHFGCGGEFLPYSAIDARLTAICAVKLASSALNNLIVDGKSLSWKEESSSAILNNIELTHRYHYFDMDNKMNDIYREECCECNPKKNGNRNSL